MSDAREATTEPSIGRVEAFSDGVIAIVITIMVLELHAPEEPGLEHLWRLWPVFLAYLLSFAYVGVYWVNHHRLLAHARRVTNALVWFNLLLLFALSLVPFATAYLGYVPLQHVIHTTGVQNDAANRYHRRTLRKGAVTVVVYLLGVPLTFVSPWLGVGAAALVAVLWFLPRSPIDGLFDG